MIFLRNVLRAPARSFMTALGIAVGVALFVSMSAITLDLHEQVDGVAQAYNFEVMVYERRASSPFASHLSQTQMQTLQQRYGAAAMPLVLGTRNEPWNAYALVIGAAPDFLRSVALTAGSTYAPGAGEAMLGEIAANKLGLQPGQTLALDGHALRISGIFRTGSHVLDGGLMTDIAVAQRMLERDGAEPQYTLALLRGVQSAQSAALIEQVNTSYPLLKAIPGTEFAGSLRLLRVVDAFAKTAAMVTLLATGLVLSNTLLMAVAERTREIGILMAVGWTPVLVLRMLLAESLLLCALGTGLGNLLALGLLRVVNNLDAVGYGWIPISFAPALTGASLVLSLSVVLLALLWPAAVLYRMQPLAALRHE